jgi:hypothetical protein
VKPSATRGRPSPRLLAVLTFATALAATLPLLVPSPAAADTPPTTIATASTEPRITLRSQDAWSPVGGTVTFHIDIAHAPPGATLNLNAYQPLTRRFDFDFVAQGGAPTGLLTNGQLSAPVEELAVDPDTGWRVVTIGLQSPNLTRDPTRLNVRAPGVYPLEIVLRDESDRTILSSFVTLLVVSPPDGQPAITERLNVVWVWPLVAAPSYLPNGASDREVTAQFLPENRLGRQAVALRTVPDVPVTLALGPETLAAWSSDPLAQGGADTIIAATATHQTLGNPYVPIDLPSLLDHGLTAAVDEELVRGSDVLLSTLGSAADGRTRLVRPVSLATLERLKASGIDRVIVEGTALTGSTATSTTASRQPTLTPASVATVRVPGANGGSETIEALATDEGFERILSSADLPEALRAQLVLGGLTVVATEAPSVRRVVALANPDYLDAQVSLYTALLTGLRNNPSLQAVSAQQGFASASDSPASAPPVEREIVSTTAADPHVLAFAYNFQRTRLNTLGALTPSGDPSVAQADRSLLASVTSAWTPDEARSLAVRHIATTDHAVDAFVRLIEVPSPRTITLTSRSGAIPLTFRNETGHNVRLRAVLTSDKLFFPEGSVLDLDLPPKSSTVRVAVETRTSGTFPIKLEVTSIDGVLPISHRRLEVRSTFVSTLGIVLMVSAVVFLAVWWGIDLRRRRRRRAQTAAS